MPGHPGRWFGLRRRAPSRWTAAALGSVFPSIQNVALARLEQQCKRAAAWAKVPRRAAESPSKAALNDATMPLELRTATGIGMLVGMLFAFQSLATPTALTALPVKIPFPAPAAIAPQVDFWTRVYVEIDTGAGFVHDTRALNVVYETMRVSGHRAKRSRQIKARKRHWREVLNKLAGGAPAASADAQRVVTLWHEALARPPTPKDFKAASKRLRFQLGQRNKFEAGLIRSGRYEARIRTILKAHGVPEDLAYLPHVESSFNTFAYSKSGAAGMWQFMRTTGRRYLRIDGVIDERLEPIKASHAAAKLLRANYDRLGTWPLAITAYNHGANGMRRAQATLGTSDIMAIIERYVSRSFGFASRNFYAQFLAARRVAREYRRHFGELRIDEVNPVHVVKLPFYADSSDVLQHLGIERKVLAALNPSLRDAVLRSPPISQTRGSSTLRTRSPRNAGSTPSAFRALIAFVAVTRWGASRGAMAPASSVWSPSMVSTARTASESGKGWRSLGSAPQPDRRARGLAKRRQRRRLQHRLEGCPSAKPRPGRPVSRRRGEAWTVSGLPSTITRAWPTLRSGFRCPSSGCGNSTRCQSGRSMWVSGSGSTSRRLAQKLSRVGAPSTIRRSSGGSSASARSREPWITPSRKARTFGSWRVRSTAFRLGCYTATTPRQPADDSCRECRSPFRCLRRSPRAELRVRSPLARAHRSVDYDEPACPAARTEATSLCPR